MKNLINCGTCGYPLTPEERTTLVEKDGVMVKPAPVPKDMVLLPKRMTKAMSYVTEQEDWTWEDLLAAAEAITEDEYNEIATQPAAPVAWRAWFDADNGARWLFTLWPEEERLDVKWEPLYIAAQRQRVVFPTMLRKMWSGGEVQKWLDENVNKENT